MENQENENQCGENEKTENQNFEQETSSNEESHQEAKLQKEFDELKDKYIRANAEFENIKKRMEKELMSKQMMS